MARGPLTLPALCAIANMDTVADVRSYADSLVTSGAELIQLRAKEQTARAFLEAAQYIVRTAREARESHAPNLKVIINDRADICAIAGADGVHVGQDDLAPSAVRALVGNDRIVGLSTHNLEQVSKTPFDLVDYIGFGPIFNSRTKIQNFPIVGTELLASAVSKSNVPVIAIGGIDISNAKAIYLAGAQSIAVIKDLESAPRLRERIADYSLAKINVVQRNTSHRESQQA